MLGNFGIRELVIILVVALVIFGTKKIATIGSDLGRAVKGFKQAMSEGEQEDLTPPKALGTKDAEFAEAKKTETEHKA